MPFTLRHLFGSSLIAAFAFILFGIYCSTLQRNWTEEQIAGELQAAAQVQAQRLSVNLSKLWQVVGMLADDASAHPADVQQTLIEARRFNPALTVLGLAKADGTVTAAAGSEDTSVAQAPWFASALKNPTVKAGPSFATTVLAKPLRNKDGTTAAVLFASVAMADFVTGPTGLPSKSVLVANDGGQLMAWENADPSFPSSPSLSRLSDVDKWIASTAWAISGPFPETGWSLTVARPKADIDQRLAPMLRKLWAACFAMACLTLLAAAAWTAWLAAPLRAISLFAAAAAEGSQVDPIRETQFQEAAILCRSLVKLCTSLRRMNAPKTFRLVETEEDVDGERDLIFDDLVLHINALMDQEGQLQPGAKQVNGQ